MANAGTVLGYNPYRDSEGKFDDGPTLLASRGRPKISASDQRKKIDAAKEKLRAKYAIEEKPDREKVLDGPKYMETPGFAINEQNLADNDVRTILWKDKELFPGQTYGQYYEENKARKGDIFMMSAAEYRKALIESGQYKDLESIENRMDWDKVEQYTEDMMSGDKFPPPQLWYEEDGSTSQEGLHRLYAAERVGIEEIPVVISSDTRNQDIYPYQQLSSKIVSQDTLHAKTTEDIAQNGPTVKLTIEGGKKAEFPAKYYRMGELPGQEGSRNWNTGELEGGVSVMKGYEDPETGKITLDGLQNEHLELLAEGEKLYEVEGTFSGLYGSDGEDLLDVSGIRYTKEIDPSVVVTDNNPDYNLLGDDVSEKYDTFPKLDNTSDTPPSSDDPENKDDGAIENVFMALSSYGEEHSQLLAKSQDPAILPSEEEAIKRQLEDTLKSAKIEAEKVIDKINQDEYDSEFISDLQATVESEQATALAAKDEEYLAILDNIIKAIFDRQAEEGITDNSIKGKTANQLAARDLPDLYKDLDIDVDNLGCIMLDLEPMKVMEYMEGHEDDLFENPKWDQGSIPAETVPHVTLLYGLLENGNKWKKKVDMVLKDWSVNSVTVEEVGYFDTPDSFAVVAHLEKTPELVDGHERLTLLPHVNTFSEYKPHMTLAYVKKDADVKKWVSALNKQYKGKKIKASGINYGDKPEKKSDNSNDVAYHLTGNDDVRSSLSSIGQDHNSISPAGYIVAYNALDSDTRAIVADQTTRLQNGFAEIEARIVEAATQKVQKNYLEDPTDVISPAERKKFEQEVESLLTTFYINLYPIFGQQLLSKRAAEYGMTTPYAVTQSSQEYIQQMAAKAATSHVTTVIKDILVAASLAYALAVGAALVTLVVAAVVAGNMKVKKKLLDNGYTLEKESIEKAVEAGIFKNEAVYKEAQKLARQGEGLDKIVRSIRNKYPEISKNRAATIARTEAARVFNQSQFEADRQFLVANGLMDRAYKKLRSRTGTPCDHCEALINRQPIPFETNFADLGTQITVTETLENGDVKVKSLPVNWEAIKAGNVHPNCNCEYVLIIKD